MQILLKALIAETGEGGKPASLIDLNAEDQSLFAEVFDLEGDIGEATIAREYGEIEIAPDLNEAQPRGDLGSLIDGDILLPEIPRQITKPTPTVVDAETLATDFVSVDASEVELDEAPLNEPQSLGLEAEISIALGETSKADEQSSRAGAGLAFPGASVALANKDEQVGRVTQQSEKSTILSVNKGEQKQIGAPDGVVPEKAAVSNPEGPETTETVIDRSAKSVTPETLERQGPRDVPLPTVRSKTVETVRAKADVVSSDEVLPRGETIDVKTAQLTQSATTTPSAAIQTAVVSTPVAQLLMQGEKGFIRDATIGPDAIVAANAGDSNDGRVPATNNTRAETAVRPIVSQVVQMAFRAAVDGVVEVRLQPEELGRLRIAMTQMDAGVVVQVSAERPETLDLLRRNIDMLERDLREQGFENPSFSFDQGSTDTQQNEEDAREFPEASRPTKTHVEVDVHPGQVTVIDGHLDIRL